MSYGESRMKFKDFLKVMIWECLNPLLLRWNRNKRYSFDPCFTGVNLGCGIDNPNNWLGIDGGATHFLVQKIPYFVTKRMFRHFSMGRNYSFDEYYSKLCSFKTIHHDLLYGIPFANESIPHIYSSHFLEHLFLKDCEFLLKECWRVLNHGGLIRIVIPSLDDEVRAIREAVIQYECGNIAPIQKYVTSDIVGYNSKFSNHRHMYNYNGIKRLLVEVGFIEVSQKDYKLGDIPDVELLDSRNGIFIEGKKP